VATRQTQFWILLKHETDGKIAGLSQELSQLTDDRLLGHVCTYATHLRRSAI